MADIIEKAREQYLGYAAAKKAVEGTKPNRLAIKKTEGEDEGGITVFYDPAEDTFDIRVNSTRQRYEKNINGITVADTKLILAALKEFFDGGGIVNAN